MVLSPTTEVVGFHTTIFMLYDEIINLLNEKISKINENKLISYSEKSYVMFLAIKKMEKNYKSSDDLLMFHQALRNWMCEHVAVI